MALVGRDVLFGCAAGVLVRLLDLVPMALSEWAETASSYIGLPIASPAALFGEVISTATGANSVPLSTAPISPRTVCSRRM